jgi:hypothetical protein
MMRDEDMDVHIDVEAMMMNTMKSPSLVWGERLI